MNAIRCSDCDRRVPVAGLPPGQAAGKAEGTQFLCHDCLDRNGEITRMKALGDRYYVPPA